MTSGYRPENGPSWSRAVSPASRWPTPQLCGVCGCLAPYTCVVCGSRFCCVDCGRTHKETRCLKRLRMDGEACLPVAPSGDSLLDDDTKHCRCCIYRIRQSTEHLRSIGLPVPSKLSLSSATGQSCSPVFGTGSLKTDKETESRYPRKRRRTDLSETSKRHQNENRPVSLRPLQNTISHASHKAPHLQRYNSHSERNSLNNDEYRRHKNQRRPTEFQLDMSRWSLNNSTATDDQSSIGPSASVVGENHGDDQSLVSDPLHLDCASSLARYRRRPEAIRQNENVSRHLTSDSSKGKLKPATISHAQLTNGQPALAQQHMSCRHQYTSNWVNRSKLPNEPSTAVYSDGFKRPGQVRRRPAVGRNDKTLANSMRTNLNGGWARQNVSSFEPSFSNDTVDHDTTTSSAESVLETPILDRQSRERSLSYRLDLNGETRSSSPLPFRTFGDNVEVEGDRCREAGQRSDDSAQPWILAALVSLWYASSAGNNIVGKMLLADFPYPLSVSLFQLMSLLLYTPVLHYLQSGQRRNSSSSTKADVKLTLRQYVRFIMPLAFAKFVSTYSSHISLWKIPVSYAHTVKATMPLYTIVLTRIFLNERHSREVYLSLVPLIGGVVLATLTEISFDGLGFASALVSTIGFAIVNMFTKYTLNATGIHHLRLLRVMTKYAFFGFLPYWLVVDAGPLFAAQHDNFNYNLSLLVADGILNVLQNILAFTIIAKVATLTYAVANSMKRVVVITLSILLLHNPVTWLNYFGMMMACLGAFLYSRAKQRQRQRDQALERIQSSAVLPYYNDQTNDDDRSSSGRLLDSFGVFLSHAKSTISLQQLLINEAHVPGSAADRLSSARRIKVLEQAKQLADNGLVGNSEQHDQHLPMLMETTEHPAGPADQSPVSNRYARAALRRSPSLQVDASIGHGVGAGPNGPRSATVYFQVV